MVYKGLPRHSTNTDLKRSCKSKPGHTKLDRAITSKRHIQIQQQKSPATQRETRLHDKEYNQSSWPAAPHSEPYDVQFC